MNTIILIIILTFLIASFYYRKDPKHEDMVGAFMIWAILFTIIGIVYQFYPKLALFFILK